MNPQQELIMRYKLDSHFKVWGFIYNKGWKWLEPNAQLFLSKLYYAN